MCFLGGSNGKESTCNEGDLCSVPRLGKFPWRRAWQATPVFFPGESPWSEEPGGPESMESQRVRHNWATKYSTECNKTVCALGKTFFMWLFIVTFILFWWSIAESALSQRCACVIETGKYEIKVTLGFSRILEGDLVVAEDWETLV